MEACGNGGAPKKVCLIGSGNWSCAIARIIGQTVTKSSLFADAINMWVYEETFNGKSLTSTINSEHENPKYLPGYKVPVNVLAVSDLKEAVRGADILIFCLPHQFLRNLQSQIKEELSSGALAVSLIKGIDFDQDGIVLISDIIRKGLGIDCSVLMGANIANEVAAGDFCETTIGCSDLHHGALLKDLFNTPTFHVSVALDPHGVELCGALKNVVALGAGFCDGLGFGGNTKAAIIRNGLIEMKRFCYRYFEGIKDDTFFESCGIADLITTCLGGRNRKCAEAFVKTKSSWEQLERDLLGGQKLQGTSTAKGVYEMLKRTDSVDRFPLLVTIYMIAHENLPAENITQFEQLS